MILTHIYHSGSIEQEQIKRAQQLDCIGSSFFGSDCLGLHSLSPACGGTLNKIVKRFYNLKHWVLNLLMPFILHVQKAEALVLF